MYTTPFRPSMRYKWYDCECDNGISTCITEFCHVGVFACSEGYAIILGLIGTVIFANDARKIIEVGCDLPCHLNRVPKFFSASLTAHQYRDIKLAGTVFAFKSYLLLLLGSLIGNENFLIPWLIFDAFYILYEFTNTIIAIIHGDYAVSKPKHFLLSMFMIYNWLAIFCATASEIIAGDAGTSTIGCVFPKHKLIMLVKLLPILDIVVASRFSTNMDYWTGNAIYLTLWVVGNAGNLLHEASLLLHAYVRGNHHACTLERCLFTLYKFYHLYRICSEILRNSAV